MTPSSSADKPNSHRRGWRSILLGFSALILVACCIYIPTLRYEMFFDDIPCIVNNESIHNLTPLFGSPDGYGPLNPQPTTPVSARPLISLTFALNYHFSQVDPFGYRLTHLVLHVMAGLILWSVIARTLAQPVFKGRYDRYRLPLAWLGSILWIVHPIHTETIVYLTQRTELIMGLFYILTVYLAIRYWESQSSYKRVAWCIAAFTASVCGMLSKEMMASVPAMVLIYEWTFVGGSILTMAKRSWMLYISLALSWLPLALIYAYGYNTPLAGFNNTISAHDFWLTQSKSFFVYWGMLFKPWPLVLHHHVPTLSTLSEAWPGVVAMLAYTLATLYLLWHRNAAGFVLLWFFAVLSPTLIVPLPHEEISERRMYAALFPVLPYLAIAAFSFTQKIRNIEFTSADHVKNGSTWNRLIGYAPAVLAIAILVIVSIVTVPRLGDRSKLWLEVLKHQPENTFAIASQGAVEFNAGDYESAIQKMEFAFDTDPSYGYFRHLLVKSLSSTQQYERLLKHCLRMVEYTPEDPISAYNLATAFEKTGRTEDALRQYKKAIALDESNWEAHSAAATLLAEKNEMMESIRHFERATELHPDFMNCMNLMGLYISTKQNKKAIRATRLLLEAARKEKPPEVVKRIEMGLNELERQQRREINLL